MQLFLLKSLGANTLALSKHRMVWQHWCILQPALPYLRLLQHSQHSCSILTTISSRKEAGLGTFRL